VLSLGYIVNMFHNQERFSLMKRSKSYFKFIACLEGPWSPDLVNRLSITPILELLLKRNGTTSVHLSSNTLQEFRFNLDIYKGIRGSGILFFAFHGRPGRIRLPDMEIEIEHLSYFMGRKFKNWIIYFDSCLTLRIERERIDQFIKETGVSMVIGFTKKVKWMESTAIDLLVLDWLQSYRNMGTFWNRFQKAYKELVTTTGLEVYHNGH
jgi:hypothetical protein